MTKQLSSAAKAVLDAATEAQHGSCYTQFERISSAALRAAADQMRYEDRLGWTGYGYYTHFQNQIRAIADELEAQ